MSVPWNTTWPLVGSISRVRHRTSVDFPEPDRPITTNTSPQPTSKLTSRTATAHPVFFLMSWTLSLSMLSSHATSEALVPKTFHSPSTLSSASLRPGVGGATTAVGALSVWMATGIS